MSSIQDRKIVAVFSQNSYNRFWFDAKEINAIETMRESGLEKDRVIAAISALTRHSEFVVGALCCTICYWSEQELEKYRNDGYELKIIAGNEQKEFVIEGAQFTVLELAYRYGEKLQFIRYLRELFGLNLKDAKNLSDQCWDEMQEAQF